MVNDTAPSEPRTVRLRDERNARDSRILYAYLDEQGSLHIDGQDLGRSTTAVSGDGEYEWFQTIRSEHLPRLIRLLGGTSADNILDLLSASWSGDRSYALEQLLREGDVPVERFVY